jgi:hypothetical protein
MITTGESVAVTAAEFFEVMEMVCRGAAQTAGFNLDGGF